MFQCPYGLELLLVQTVQDFHRVMSQCPHGLELLRYVLDQQELMRTGFNALTGLSCYSKAVKRRSEGYCFNDLTGLSCYGKNVQYFKFFMILFYTYLLFIGVY